MYVALASHTLFTIDAPHNDEISSHPWPCTCRHQLTQIMCDRLHVDNLITQIYTDVKLFSLTANLPKV